KTRAFALGVVGDPLFHARKAHRGLQEVRAAGAEARGCREAVEAVLPRSAGTHRTRRGVRRLLVGLQPLDGVDHAAAVVATLLLAVLDLLQQARLDDDAAHLRRDGTQDAQLVGGELPAPERLHHEHAERRLALDHGNADEGVELLLARL